ncbi:MAG: hypothetical protein WBL74_05635 [Novosphingobium sp.]|uniref:hypothetical protein n=1 Tax=Novosphingobium sp. TaxID=1874826 RepID=UPI003C7C5831
MAEHPNNTDLADRLTKRRARMMPALAVLFLAQQASYFSRIPGERLVDHVRIGAWVALSAVLLAVLTTGGFWLRSAAVRALMNDEVTRANRAAAMQFGLVLALGGGIALYPFIDQLGLNARQVIHLIVSLGLAAAMLRFGMLERRALG